MIQLTHETIDPQKALHQVQSTQSGAVVLFLGTAREFTDGRQTVGLQYEGYREMAERKLAELEAEARGRWPVIGCALIHRLGPIELGEASVLVAVSTPHRREAFEAAAWLMDTIKRDVPIWKQEHWADGRTDWIHPGCENLAPSQASEGPTPAASRFQGGSK